ncbi:O-antigen ligase family protein [Microbacterium sp. No. 7]|uniref:O-antigen ligase family protein n=1 Tax=Microbacterium sp. No. 7 TaxID=1714373 RepID=UPI0012E270D3|nr:O-antigen ligase family protein [Microbacterium sp. No. 7]
MDILMALLVPVAAFFVGALFVFIPSRLLWNTFALLSSINPTSISVPAGAPAIFSLATVLKTGRHFLQALAAPATLLLLALAVWYFFSALWSPRATGALTTGVAVLGVVAAAALSAAACDGDPRALIRRMMIVLAPLAILQSLATIIFRVNPAIEDSYFRSEFFHLLLGDDAAFLFTTRTNNVTDPEKAGGLLFVNGNRASMVMAVWALMYLAMWFQRRAAWTLFMAAVCMGGALATSSKTAIVLAIIVPVIFFLLPWVVAGARSPLSVLLGLVLMGGFAFLTVRLADYLPQALTGAEQSAEDRANFANAAAGYFSEQPFFGLGFGGWEAAWAQDAHSFGMRPDLPPHNFVIAGWANAGVIAVALFFAVIAVLVFQYLKLMREADSSRQARAFSMQLGAIAWMVAHATFDNTDFYGVPNTIPVFAILVTQAGILLRQQKLRAEERSVATSEARPRLRKS